MSSLMLTFSKPLNAIILILGGYVLQITDIYEHNVNTEYKIKKINCSFIIIQTQY